MNHSKKPKIGVTVGDPAGIGPEIVLKAMICEQCVSSYDVIVFADRVTLEQAMSCTGLKMPLLEIDHPDACDPKSQSIHFMPVNVLDTPVPMGRISAACGASVIRQIELAAAWALNGWIDAVATAPLQKESLKASGCPWLDHTEMLKAFTHSEHAATLFVVDNLRVFFLTRHLALKQVGDALHEDLFMEAVPRCLDDLRMLGVCDPKLAVAALNPHGGENGLFGTEERDLIFPVIQKLQADGHAVQGPIPADSVFHLAREGHFDGVLSLYHDQGHIATKTLDFYRTISMTLGLPFLRTSVDHGTAFDIAGRNEANPISMAEAIRMAALYAPHIQKWNRK